MRKMQNDDNLYLRLAAQTTFNDKELVARAVGFSLGPGLVDFVDGPSLSAYPPALAPSLPNSKL